MKSNMKIAYQKPLCHDVKMMPEGFIAVSTDTGVDNPFDGNTTDPWSMPFGI